MSPRTYTDPYKTETEITENPLVATRRANIVYSISVKNAYEAERGRSFSKYTNRRKPDDYPGKGKSDQQIFYDEWSIAAAFRAYQIRNPAQNINDLFDKFYLFLFSRIARYQVARARDLIRILDRAAKKYHKVEKHRRRRSSLLLSRSLLSVRNEVNEIKLLLETAANEVKKLTTRRLDDQGIDEDIRKRIVNTRWADGLLQEFDEEVERCKKFILEIKKEITNAEKESREISRLEVAIISLIAALVLGLTLRC